MFVADNWITKSNFLINIPENTRKPYLNNAFIKSENNIVKFDKKLIKYVHI